MQDRAGNYITPTGRLVWPDDAVVFGSSAKLQPYQQEVIDAMDEVIEADYSHIERRVLAHMSRGTMSGKLTKKQREARDALVAMNAPEVRRTIVDETPSNQESARAAYNSYMARHRLHKALETVAKTVASKLKPLDYRQKLLTTTAMYDPATEVYVYGMPSNSAP